jgi:uncharacterized membrane protein
MGTFVLAADLSSLVLVFGWVIAILIGLLGLVVVWLILIGKINLQNLLAEPNGSASMSRFQFLIFTFVIGLSLYLIIVSKMEFPTIPGSILALLGISSGSYVTSKGIQASKEVSLGTGDGGNGGGNGNGKGSGT